MGGPWVNRGQQLRKDWIFLLGLWAVLQRGFYNSPLDPPSLSGFLFLRVSSSSLTHSHSCYRPWHNALRGPSPVPPCCAACILAKEIFFFITSLLLMFHYSQENDINIRCDRGAREKYSVNDTFGYDPSTQEAELEPIDSISGWF